ncbi:hypothetical protein BPAE_0084g00110 [Botrytis paeoniae]|uniref:Uncharacterized protein n=1 Tax=Botrytis paeoniae TaxID=278948 RepID=A0A4Z1FKB8_9HELO|nr:hypothetical protein BPAE_0084g00110 [Botrytis paeoniae]
MKDRLVEASRESSKFYGGTQITSTVIYFKISTKEQSSPNLYGEKYINIICFAIISILLKD